MVFIINCDKDEPTQPGTDYSNYFPLEIDNKWYYYHVGVPDALVIYRIWDTATYDNKIYSLFGNKVESSDLFRKDDKGNIYKKRPDKELLWFAFSEDHGGSYEVKLSDKFIYTVKVEKSLTIEYDGHKYVDCVRFTFDAPNIKDEEMVYVFAPDVGIVQMLGAWVSLYLDSYEF